MTGSGVFVTAKVTVDDGGTVGDKASCAFELVVVVEKGAEGAE